MFKRKNLSIQYLTFLSAFIISIVVAIVFALITHNWAITFIGFVFFLTSIYFFLSYVFNWFIYRKIKLIYKLIYNTKANKKAESYYKHILPQKSIEEVGEEVA